MGEITIPDDSAPIGATVGYKDAKGVDTHPADVPVWSSSDDSVATVEASEDGLSATIVPGTPAPEGSAVVISALAHDDDGEAVISSGTVTVQPGDAVLGEITFNNA